MAIPNSPQYVSGLCTVVCTTFNHDRYVCAGLNSLANQTYRQLEVIIIDDGSSDNTVECIRRATKDFPFPIELVCQTNSGNVAMNCNLGLRRARGEYISMFSLDDVLLANCLAEKIYILRRARQLAFAANTCHVEISEDGSVVCPLYKAALYGRQDITAAAAEEIEFQTLATFWLQGAVIRHSVFDSIGNYDVDLAGDDLIVRTKLWRYLKNNPRSGFALLDRPGFEYRKHATNVHKDIQRQAQTIKDWSARYFPGRPMPAIVRPLLAEYDSLQNAAGSGLGVEAVRPQPRRARKAKFVQRVRRIVSRLQRCVRCSTGTDNG